MVIAKLVSIGNMEIFKKQVENIIFKVRND